MIGKRDATLDHVIHRMCNLVSAASVALSLCRVGWVEDLHKNETATSNLIAVALSGLVNRISIRSACPEEFEALTFFRTPRTKTWESKPFGCV